MTLSCPALSTPSLHMVFMEGQYLSLRVGRNSLPPHPRWKPQNQTGNNRAKEGELLTGPSDNLLSPSESVPLSRDRLQTTRLGGCRAAQVETEGLSLLCCQPSPRDKREIHLGGGGSMDGPGSVHSSLHRVEKRHISSNGSNSNLLKPHLQLPSHLPGGDAAAPRGSPGFHISTRSVPLWS